MLYRVDVKNRVLIIIPYNVLNSCSKFFLPDLKKINNNKLSLSSYKNQIFHHNSIQCIEFMFKVYFSNFFSICFCFFFQFYLWKKIILNMNSIHCIDLWWKLWFFHHLLKLKKKFQKKQQKTKINRKNKQIFKKTQIISFKQVTFSTRTRYIVSSSCQKVNFSTRTRYIVSSLCWKLDAMYRVHVETFSTWTQYIVSSSCWKIEFSRPTRYIVLSSCLKFFFSYLFWFFWNLFLSLKWWKN